MALRKIDDSGSKSEPGSFLCSPRDQLMVPGASFDEDQSCNDWEYAKSHPTSTTTHRNARGGPKKVSSQEFFSVTFDLLDEAGYELIPVVRGHTLRDTLGRIIEKKGLSMASVAIYQDGFQSPLSWTYDISRLGGCHLHVKALNSNSTTTASKIDDGHQGSLKSSSSRERLEAQRKGSSRSLKGLFGLSADDGSSNDLVMSTAIGSSCQTSCCNLENSRIGKTKSQGKLSGLFSNPFKDKEKMEQLTDILNRYSQHGIPKLPFTVFGPDDFDDYHDIKATEECSLDDKGLLYLEDSWTQVVDGSQNLSERIWQQQSAIWELLTTEVSYIQKLKVIRDLFMACLCNLQNEKILTEIDFEVLFGNINELLQSNLSLWKKCLLPMLNHSRVTRQPFDPSIMKETFYKFDHLFAPYIKFFLEQNSCIQHLKEFYQDNELFKTYLAWCEAQKECNRQRLVDLMVKPMERLTKYALILKVVHKRSDDEVQQADLLEMISCVEAFVSGVNSTMRCRHEQQRLANIINRIDCYEPVECKDDEIEKILKTYLYLDLTCPMVGCPPQHSRQLLLEGDLKMRDFSSLSKMDVHCFLFTDMLLVCKHIAKKGERMKVIRQPYLVDRLEVHELSKEPSGVFLVYLNELKVAITAFTLHSSESKLWLENLRKAQEHYKEAKATQPEVTFYIRDEEEFDYGNFSGNYFISCRSPRGSGGSSLIHSHSGSVDLSEPALGSISHQSRAASLEMSDKRASSASSDEGSTAEVQRAKCSISDYCRSPTTQPLSPRPERRAFFLKSNSGNSTPNTLSVGYPYSGSDSGLKSSSELSPTSLTIPLSKCISSSKQSRSMPLVQPQSPRMLRRSGPLSPSPKPPLVKTKNVYQGAGGGNITKSEESGTSISSCCCFDFDIPVIQALSTGCSNHSSVDEESKSERGTSHCCRTTHRRHILVDRRCHTADSIEIVRGSGREAVLQKHLSWHFEHGASSRSRETELVPPLRVAPLIVPHLHRNVTSEEKRDQGTKLHPPLHHSLTCTSPSTLKSSISEHLSNIQGKQYKRNKSTDVHSPT
ncbi:hypothetical protein CHUAL_009083 [Chamberlinius hualienensis]